VRDSGVQPVPTYVSKISKRRGFEHSREYVWVYEGEASPSLFVGRVRVVSKGSARGRGSNWSRIRLKPNFSTRARYPSPCPFPAASKERAATILIVGVPTPVAPRHCTCKNIYNRSDTTFQKGKSREGKEQLMSAEGGQSWTKLEAIRKGCPLSHSLSPAITPFLVAPEGVKWISGSQRDPLKWASKIVSVHWNGVRDFNNAN